MPRQQDDGPAVARHYGLTFFGWSNSEVVWSSFGTDNIRISVHPRRSSLCVGLQDCAQDTTIQVEDFSGSIYAHGVSWPCSNAIVDTYLGGLLAIEDFEFEQAIGSSVLVGIQSGWTPDAFEL